ncbi:hypothetical protein C2E25_09145 [Geothermobacter hydrogeniphilus]|uniref:Alginate export domain-containing protein n=1 Tax=Geothermobacter hydrogeniphilus TaxID=1969733 RepID=A0A2K2H9U6_9BACT|nr:hypothetical protein [Geothermobacter hydrogeniphilus]PNU20072.1 hypothetical protein C2E25_09145 [Geothermobacter hydrogeniphilus]
MKVRFCVARGLLLAVLALLALPMNSAAVELRVQSDTLLRVFERDTTSGTDNLVTPGYEYLQVDMGSLSEAGLSFHAYGWGRYDFADNDFYQDADAGELLYGYLEYKRENANLNIRLGRQYIFEGVANESVDGLRLSSDLSENISASIYAGQPVGLDSTSGRSGDSIYGGRVALHKMSLGEVGLSYKNIQNDSDTAEEMAGVDIALYLPKGINFFGNSSYNLDSNGFAEHSYEFSIPYENFRFRPFFQMFNYADYFATGANSVNPFRVLATGDEEISIYGIDLSWLKSEAWTFVGKFKYYDYDQADGNQYYGLAATWHPGEATDLGGEVGYLNGDLSKNTYLLTRLFATVDQLGDKLWLDFLTGDIVYASYDQDIYGEDYSLFVSLGTGKTFLDGRLRVKLSGDYSQDPYFDDDLRGLLSLTYNYDHGL